MDLSTNELTTKPLATTSATSPLTPTTTVSSRKMSVNELTSLWTTTEILSSVHHDDVTQLIWTTGVTDFAREENVTASANSSIMVSNNSSVPAMMKNDTILDVNLEALNLSMTMSLLPTVIYLVVLMAVGLVGNSIVFLVYYKRFKPSATRTYVLAMCVCDWLANAFSLPSEILDIRYTFTFDLPWLCRSIRATNSFLTLTSAFVLVAVARDRFNKICHPLEKRRSMKRIRIYVLICALASVALSLIFGALNGSQTIPTGVGNFTGITCSVSGEFLDTLFPLMYNMIMAVTFISCVVIMTVSYIRIALELWRHKKKQARVSGVAPTPSKDHSKTHSPIVEDTSSGPRHDLHHSETKSSSTAELIPMKTTSGTKSKSKATSPATTPANTSDKVLLLSVNNLNYEGPKSSVEDSDEGCFSGCSAETTSTSVDMSKEGTVHTNQATQGDSQTANVHVHIVDENEDKEVKKLDTDTETKPEVPESAQKNGSGSLDATAIEDHAMTPLDSQDASQDSQTKTSTIQDKHDSDDGSSNHHRHTDDSSLSPHHKTTTTTTKPSSLWQKFLMSRRRHQYDFSKESALKPSQRCQIPKKRGTVKSIPSSTTLMMFVLTATFVINYLPHLIIISMRAMSDDFGKGLTGAMLNAYNVGLRSYFMNCAVNSLVYGFCSARFRQECGLLFSRK